MTKKQHEILLGFRILDDNEDFHLIEVELRTSKDTYKDYWEYELKNGGIVFKQNIWSWCKAMNIDTTYYLGGRVGKFTLSDTWGRNRKKGISYEYCSKVL